MSSLKQTDLNIRDYKCVGTFTFPDKGTKIRRTL